MNEKRPIVGITTFNTKKAKKTYVTVSNSYCTSVEKVGGTPIILSLCVDTVILDNYLGLIDALIITGGDEAVNPLLYGENPIQGLNATCPNRDECEIYLLRGALKRDIPVLGICRGMQLMNVAGGGTLYQDIVRQKEGVLGHLPTDMPVDELYHHILIEKESRIYDIFGSEKILINSFHNQAVKGLSEHYLPTAISEDDIIEAMEHKDKNFAVGVQWHPEDLTIRHPQFLKLFQALIEAVPIK
ncbi:MAG: gamma-glutamyl-gamma-aminobutyrate hydrolase family protein [Desulfotalea sp.]